MRCGQQLHYIGQVSSTVKMIWNAEYNYYDNSIVKIWVTE